VGQNFIVFCIQKMLYDLSRGQPVGHR
jgi:hypothetical protein